MKSSKNKQESTKRNEPSTMMIMKHKEELSTAPALPLAATPPVLLLVVPARPLLELVEHLLGLVGQVLDGVEDLDQVGVGVLQPLLRGDAADRRQAPPHRRSGGVDELLLRQPQARRGDLALRQPLLLQLQQLELLRRALVLAQQHAAVTHEQLQHLVLVHGRHDAVLLEGHRHQLAGLLHASEAHVRQQLQGHAVGEHGELLVVRRHAHALQDLRLGRVQAVGGGGAGAEHHEVAAVAAVHAPRGEEQLAVVAREGVHHGHGHGLPALGGAHGGDALRGGVVIHHARRRPQSHLAGRRPASGYRGVDTRRRRSHKR
mmetsp:Transcript_27418/g.67383  ORF Transcript_27418/g.67383 Transcript_27418/m.67383 type:complete len:317 (+) Transcript_27418:123-1073(+)